MKGNCGQDEWWEMRRLMRWEKVRRERISVNWSLGDPVSAR